MNTSKYLWILVFYLHLFLSYCDVIVPTNYGKVRGKRTESGYAFLGIPYAAPPVGDLRWRPPVEPTPWSPRVYNATALPPACPQRLCNKFLPPISCPNVTNESCLYMNIWTPTVIAEKLPVMVFIHGGAFIYCSSDVSVWNGEQISMLGRVILVNFNYRLGLMGFLYTGNGPNDAKGNFGIQDQRLALRWVQENIAYFGGDPNRVTLFGQSAGAQSTLIHMMSPKSKGLFHQVIIESPPSGLPYKDVAEAQKLADDVSKRLRCEERNINCLRQRQLGAILDVQEDIYLKPISLDLFLLFENIGPVIDGDEVPADPITASNEDKLRHYPTMLGTVTEETRMFIYEGWKIKLTKPELKAVILATFPTHAEEILDKYPPPEEVEDYRDFLTYLYSDFLFTCPVRNSSNNLIKFDDEQVFRYVFDHSLVYPNKWSSLSLCYGHVCHAAELPFVFHNLLNYTADEDRLSLRMLSYWTNFAHTSNPNLGPDPNVPEWPNNDKNLLKYFKTPLDDTIDDYRSDLCNFWDTIGYEQPSEKSIPGNHILSAKDVTRN